MGKSLVIKGIDASMVGLGKVYFSGTPIEPDVPVEPDIPVEPELNTIEAVEDRLNFYLTYQAGEVRSEALNGYGYKYYDVTEYRGKTIRVTTLQNLGSSGYGCSYALLRNASVAESAAGTLANAGESIYAAIRPSESLVRETIDLYISQSVQYLLVGYAITSEFDSSDVLVQVVDDMSVPVGDFLTTYTIPNYYIYTQTGAVYNMRLNSNAINLLAIPNIGALYGRSKLRITSCQTKGDYGDGVIVAVTSSAIGVGGSGMIAPATNVLFLRQPRTPNTPEIVELELPEDAYYLLIGCLTNTEFSIEDVKVEIIDELSPVPQVWTDIPQGSVSPRQNYFLRFNNGAVKADVISNSPYGYRVCGNMGNYVGQTIRITTCQSLGDSNNGCLVAIGKNAKNITTEHVGNLLDAGDVLYSKQPSVSDEVETVEFVVPAESTYLFVGYHEVGDFVNTDVKIQVLED